MLIIQYLTILIFIQLSQSVISPEDQNSSNRYYTSNNSTSSLIDYMRTLYDQEKSGQKNSDYNLIRALAPRLVEIDNVTMYVFDLNVIRRTEQLYAVSLHFYKRRTRWPISYSINEIYSVHRLSSLSAQIQLEPELFGWQSFPIGDVIQRQINYLSFTQRSEYFGITFKPTVTTRTQRRNILDLEKFSIHTPFLVVYSKDAKEASVFEEFIPKNFEQDVKAYEAYENEVKQRNNRFRRSIGSNTEAPNLLSNWNITIPVSEADICSMKPLLIDFSDLGFSSWMIAPKNFMANLCSGACQSKSMTNHALLQSFLQRLGVRSDLDLSKAACVPDRYSSLIIFYKSSDYHYLIRRLPNMIVEACQCR